MSIPRIPHIPDELQKGVTGVVVQTKYGPVKGGRTTNGAAVFLGEVVKQITSTHADLGTKRYPMRCLPFALRTQSLYLLIIGMKTRIIFMKPNVRQTVKFL